MKRTRLMMTVMLLFALFVASCAQAVKPAGEIPAAEEAPGMELPEFRDFPADAYPQPVTADPVRVEDDTLFHAKFEGDAVSGSGGAVGGKYHFIATQTDGESWHVKLEANYPTVAGRDYSVTYRFTSDVSGKVKFGDFQEFEIKEGENTVTGIFTAKDSTSYLDLQLGMLQPFTIDFTEIEVKEYADEVDYENALPAPVNFQRESRVYERHDQGYGTILVRANHAININYESIPMDLGVWKSRLYVRTGLIPEPGVRYRVTADVMCDLYDRNIPFEVLFNDGDAEKGYGALYGQEMVPGEVKTCEAVITGNGNGDELILQFSLGEARAGVLIIVGNVRVDKIVDRYSDSLADGFALDTSTATGAMIEELVPVSYTNIPISPSFYSGVDTVYEQHDDGYIVNLTEGASSATMAIVQAPANATDRGVWKAKLYAATGASLEPNTSYRIRFDLDSTGNQADYEVCFDGDTENAYGALYGRSLTAGGTDHIDMLVTPDANNGPLTIRLQLGKTDTASGNTVTLKNLTVESVKLQYTDVPLDDFSYTTGLNVWEGYDDGYDTEVSADGNSATLAIKSAPESDRGVWKSKLYINTGVTPEAGEQYVVHFDIESEKDQAKYEVCFDGNPENKYGALYEQKLTAGETHTVSYSIAPKEAEDVDGPIVLRFQLGETDDASGNTVTVSNIRVCKLGDDYVMEEVPLPDDFAYPAVTESSTDPGSFDLEANSGAVAELTGDGASATATVTTPGADWNVKFYAKPGVELEAGVTYTISMDVTGASACTACYKNTATGAEDGFGTESISDGTVTHIVTPSDGGALEIMLKIGDVPAGTAVTVGNIKIMKTTTDFIQIPVDIKYPSVSDPTTIHVDDEYVAQDVSLSASAVAWDGSEATARIDGSAAVLDVTKAHDSGGMWNTRLEVNTGVVLEQGVEYRISGTLTSAKPLDFEVLYSNGSGTDEGGHNPGGQGYAEGSWGLKVESENGSCYFEKTFTVPERSEYRPLVLRIQVGNGPAPNTITVSNIEVEKVIPGHDVTVPGEADPGSFFLEANSGAAAELSGTGSSAIATVTTPGADWNVKFYAKPGTTLEAGKTYQISMDVTGASGCTACYKNTVTGAEDGFGTEPISNGTVTHVVTPSEGGGLEIMLKIGNVPAGTAVTVSNIRIAEFKTGDVDVTPEGFSYPTTTGGGLEKNSFDLEANEGTAAELSGTGSSAIAKVTIPGDDWHVKFCAKPGVVLEAGSTYQISMDVSGAAGCTACYKNKETGAEDGFGTEPISDGTVTHTVIANDSGELEILLKIGTLPADTEVAISNIKIMKVTPSEGENLMKDPLVAWAPIHAFVHEDYEAHLTNTDSSASAVITKVPSSDREPWKIKLFAETGAELEAGKTYRVSVDVQATGTMQYDICYNNKEAEAALGAKYGLMASTGKSTVTYTVTPDADAVLFLQFNLGNASGPNTVTISNVKVEEVSYASSTNVIPNFSYDSVGYISKASDDGYITSLEQGNSSATFDIIKAPAERHAWNAKVIVRTGITPKPGVGYRISFNVNATKPQNLFEVFYNGNEELAYGAQYEQYLAAGNNSFSYTIMPGDSKGELVLHLRFGETNGTDGNTYTISNFKFEEVAFVSTVRPEIKDVVENVTQDGYSAQLTKTPDSAMLRLVQTPSEGLEAWKNKLFVNTGVTLEPGQKYRVFFNVRSIIPAPFEVCFNNGDVEKGLGAIFGLTSDPAGTYIEYTTYVNEPTRLAIQLSLGNCTTPNTFFLSDVRVEQAGKIDLVSDTIYTF